MKITGITYASKSRRKRRTKLSTVLIVLLLLILVVISAMSTRVAWNLVHPERLTADKIFNKADFPTVKDVEFNDSKNKVKLRGWFFKSEGSERTIILSHGYSKNRMPFNKQTNDFFKTALERNYNVLTFDFRGCGASEGDKTTLGYYEKDDLQGAINFVKSSGSTHNLVLGVSMGAATAILTASENPGALDGIIVDSSFSDLKEYLYGNLSVWSGLPKFPFSYFILPITTLATGVNPGDVIPVKAIEKIPAERIMLIHSKDDTSIPFSESQALFKAADSAAVYWEVKNAPHGKIFETYTKDYIDRVFAFTDKRIAQSIAEKQQAQNAAENQQNPNNQVVTPAPDAVQNDLAGGANHNVQINTPNGQNTNNQDTPAAPTTAPQQPVQTPVSQGTSGSVNGSDSPNGTSAGNGSASPNGTQSGNGTATNNESPANNNGGDNTGTNSGTGTPNDSGANTNEGNSTQTQNNTSSEQPSGENTVAPAQ